MNNKVVENYKKIVREILVKRAQGKRINRYEYYALGGLPLKDAPQIVERLYRSGKITAYEYSMLREFFSRQKAQIAIRDKNFILKTQYQFGDVIITDSEKENIWNSLYLLGLSDNEIDDLVFAGAVRAYDKEKGLIKTKVDAKSKKLTKNK